MRTPLHPAALASVPHGVVLVRVRVRVRTPRWAEGSAPPRPRPPARALKKTSHVARLKTSLRFAPLPTPTAPKRSPRAPAPFAHDDACGGRSPCRDARLKTNARGRCLENRPSACRTNSGLRTPKGRLTWRYIYVRGRRPGVSQPPLSSLTTRAYHTHTRAHFPPNWLLCHTGLY